MIIKKTMKTLVIIPSRLTAVRLPGKPLLKINGLSIISHVYKKAKEANIGEVFVATEDQEIIDDVNLNGGKAICMNQSWNKNCEDSSFGIDRLSDIIGKVFG